MTSEKSYSATLTKAITDYKSVYLTPLPKYRIAEPATDILRLESKEELEDTSKTQMRKVLLGQVVSLKNTASSRLSQIQQVAVPHI